MDAPPPENVRPFLAVARLLGSAGLAVPAILAADESAGLLLLEDFGDDTYTRLLARGESEEHLYELAVDLLIELRRRLPLEKLDALPLFDEARTMEGVGRFLDWYWPAVQGAAAPADAVEGFVAAWRTVLPLWDKVPFGPRPLRLPCRQSDHAGGAAAASPPWACWISRMRCAGPAASTSSR